MNAGSMKVIENILIWALSDADFIITIIIRLTNITIISNIVYLITIWTIS
jgi:hypothetical protein